MKNIQIGTRFLFVLSKRMFLFFIIWIILADGDISSLWIGVPAVLLSSIISLILVPPVFWNFTAFLKFIPFYLIRSLLGGFDVMLRVFHPALPINPGLLKYQLHLPKGVQQDMIVNVLNLLPGTLSVEIENNLLLIHVLDIGKNIKQEVLLIEDYINEIFSKKTNTQGSSNEKI
ncbi:Na+/H+ antiporter subunit E [Sulfurimonas hydrogeniphila]|uniref:Na+/H+ antiporter subunit E n=1 Tax=Sulfurimonas hydrogeniphila TaxID=2509341 RepID=UPI00125F1E53|nr:Na+/H+ antiporter subunit E [Sulfurimonas hydrogeniphila]